MKWHCDVCQNTFEGNNRTEMEIHFLDHLEEYIEVIYE